MGLVDNWQLYWSPQSVDSLGAFPSVLTGQSAAKYLNVLFSPPCRTLGLKSLVYSTSFLIPDLGLCY